jgi:hypothetical protein
MLVSLLLGLALQDSLPAPELLPHAQLVERMRALDAGSAVVDVVPLLPNQRSRADRELLALRLAAPDAPADRPAILLVAGVDGPNLFSSAVALQHAEQLAERWSADDEDTRAFLESTTLYVVPRAHPDAAEARFASPLAEVEATGHGVDDDRDGRSGEDAPADVDGDGQITWMRVPDPEGGWIEDPTDPRALIEADRDKGQAGRWKLVREGFDNDGDERASEDAPSDARVNHNFSHDWKEHGASAGRFPMDEPEARALAEFMLVHKDVALVVTYGALDNLVSAPKGVKSGGSRVPPSGVTESDAKLLAELGRRYAEATESAVKGHGQVEGSFQTWAYHHRGLFALDIVLWDIPLDAKPKPAEPEEADEPEADSETGEEPAEEPAEKEPAGKDTNKKKDPKPSDDAKRLVWIDAEDEGSRFVPWTAFEHPQLGPVEIGGFAPYARLEPPAETAAAIANAQLEFLLSLGAVLPRVQLTDCQARALGGGLIEVEAVVTIDSLLPLQSASAQRARTVRPARLELLVPDGAEVLAGQTAELIRELDGSGGRREFRWLVRGAAPGSVGLRVATDNAGSDECIPEVK